jgi:hypothetical protein
VIGGAKPSYEKYFHLGTPSQVGWAMSSALLGCLVGAVLSGALSDAFGRKRPLILAGAIFTLSSLGTALSGSFASFVFNRLLGGVAMVENLARVHRTIGDAVDAVFLCGTDFGTQTSAFCSVPTFRDLWLPYYKRICDWIHAHTTWKCFKHSCGSVRRFYDSFIEAGFEIINPVQCSAAGMDPQPLKQDFGDRLVFWGGGVDTQKTLPFGTPDQVREQVLRRCEIFAPGGGFVFNSIHNVQAGTPVANLVAMFDAVREFNGRD